MSGLRLLLLGSPRLEKHGDALNFGRRTALALLAYLAVAKAPQRRQTLTTLFWPDADPVRAHAYLRRDLALLNKALGPSVLNSDRETIELTHPDELWVDVNHFRRLLSITETHGHSQQDVCTLCMPSLEQAVALYRGDFMAGFTIPYAGEFDEWQLFEAEDLRRRYGDALSRLATGCAGNGEFAAGIQYAKLWVQLDPCQEAAHRRLMQLYAWSGDRTAAVHQYHECVRCLEQNLGITPEGATDELYERIRLGRVITPPVLASGGAPVVKNATRTPPEPPGSPAVEGAGSGSANGAAGLPRHNLPVQLTPFFGREAELAEVSRLLRTEPACHLLTVVGLAGMGKTRFAIEVAFQVIDAFPGGVFYVPLGAVSSAERIVFAIASAVGLSFHDRTDPQTQLLDYLREKTILLVLDNFEHLLDGIALLSDILAHAPHVKLLVTSQERLMFSPAWVWTLQGLTYPSGDLLKGEDAGRVPMDAPQPPDPSPTAQAFSAVSLFTNTARRLRPSFTLSDPRDQLAVLQICRYLEGMPLAVEVAASWVNLMSCDEIAHQIAQDLDFLSISAQDMPARHRNMRLLLEHAWLHLGEPEQHLLATLTVFHGGFTRDAAEQVAGASLPMLATLADRFMLRRQPTGRYDMHSLMRQLATEKLHAVVGDKRLANDRHADYFTAFVRVREASLSDAGQRQALNEIGVEIYNVRAAWQWALANGRFEDIEQLFEGLYRFYFRRSWYQEGADTFGQAAAALQTALDCPAPGLAETPEAGELGRERLLLGRLLARQERFAYRVGQTHAARQMLENSRRILARLEENGWPGARQARAFTMYYLGELAFDNGQTDEARQLCSESLTIYAESDDLSGMAMAKRHLGINAATKGDPETARQIFQEVVELYQMTGDQYGLANAINDLAIVSDWLGDPAEAGRLHAVSLSIRRAIGQKAGIAASLNNTGYFAFLHGDYPKARELLEESRDILREIGDRSELANCLCNLGRTVCALGEFDAGQRYLNEALQLAAAAGNVRLLMEVLAAIGGWLAEHDAATRAAAVQMFTFVARHPASDRATKMLARDQLERLGVELPPETAAASPHDKPDNWQPAVRKLLSGTGFSLA